MIDKYEYKKFKDNRNFEIFLSDSRFISYCELIFQS